MVVYSVQWARKQRCASCAKKSRDSQLKVRSQQCSSKRQVKRFSQMRTATWRRIARQTVARSWTKNPRIWLQTVASVGKFGRNLVEVNCKNSWKTVEKRSKKRQDMRRNSRMRPKNCKRETANVAATHLRAVGAAWTQPSCSIFAQWRSSQAAAGALPSNVKSTASRRSRRRWGR